MNKKILLLLVSIFIILSIVFIILNNKKKSESGNSIIEGLKDKNSSVDTGIREKEDSKIDNTDLNEIVEEEHNTNFDVENNKKQQEKKLEILNELMPSGFMGSSFYKVILYSNGDVHVITYDGNGYEKNNITSETLVAKNTTKIEKAVNEENYGMIIVYSKNIIDNSIGWILFK